MAKLKERRKKLKVESKIEDRKILQEFRPYLGASGIGNECHRAIWYGFRCVKKRYITPRQQRLFSRGHKEEPIILADLEAVGVKISGLQLEGKFASDHGGGHCDGILSKLPGLKKIDVLNEIKTANDANFKKAKRLGIRKWKIGYYDQCQAYMKLFKLTKCLFIVVNKNDDERYYEIIDFDPVYADQVICRGNNIAFDPNMPRRLSESPEFYLCKWCDYSGICFGEEKPLKHCRTCRHSRPISKGRWKCDKKGKTIPWHKKSKKNKQLKGCKKYKSFI